LSGNADLLGSIVPARRCRAILDWASHQKSQSRAALFCEEYASNGRFQNSRSVFSASEGEFQCCVSGMERVDTEVGWITSFCAKAHNFSELRGGLLDQFENISLSPVVSHGVVIISSLRNHFIP
jgi:hypothetical protein